MNRFDCVWEEALKQGFEKNGISASVYSIFTPKKILLLGVTEDHPVNGQTTESFQPVMSQ